MQNTDFLTSRIIWTQFKALFDFFDNIDSEDQINSAHTPSHSSRLQFAPCMFQNLSSQSEWHTWSPKLAGIFTPQQSKCCNHRGRVNTRHFVFDELLSRGFVLHSANGFKQPRFHVTQSDSRPLKSRNVSGFKGEKCHSFSTSSCLSYADKSVSVFLKWQFNNEVERCVSLVGWQIYHRFKPLHVQQIRTSYYFYLTTQLFWSW